VSDQTGRDLGVSQYDPAENPRNPGVVEYLDEELIASLTERLGRAMIKERMFVNEGWPLVQEDIMAEIKAAENALIEGNYTEEREAHELRGQIKAARRLLQLKERITQERKRLQMEVDFASGLSPQD
jgi:hypothetical protein